MMNFINLKIKLVQSFKDIYTYIQYIYKCECWFVHQTGRGKAARAARSLSVSDSEGGAGSM
jgi:hypothetical protein